MALGSATAVLELDSPASRRIFINYRREDTEGHVLALVPLLCHRLGERRVFKDTDSISAGEDFVKALERELRSCTVMLVVIGRSWLTIQDPRLQTRRLDNPDDFVRVEVTTALQNQRMLVVPVLVAGATMPAAEDLPRDLRDLARRQAFSLTSSHWTADVEKLIDEIEAKSADTTDTRLRLWLLPFRRRFQVAAAVVLSVLTSFSVWQLAGNRAVSPQSPATEPPVSTPTSTALPLQPSEKPEPPTQVEPPTPRADAPTQPAPRPRSSPDARDMRLLGDAEATAARGRQRAEAEGASQDALTPGLQRQRAADRLRDTGQVDSAIQSYLAAAAEFDRAATAAKVTTKPSPTHSPAADTPPTSGGSRPGRGAPATVRDGGDAGIRQTLERFRQAYSNKDEQTLRDVYPGMRTDKLFANLSACAGVSLSFNETKVQLVNANEAVVDVMATYGCRPKTAQKEQVSKPVRDTFRLQLRETGWVIDRRQITLDGG